jgi:phage-related protein
MGTIADLVIKLSANTSSAEKDISSFSGKVSKGLGRAMVPATLALGALGVVGKAAFDNLQDGAKNAKLTESVLKSTGSAAHVTASHVDSLAMTLRRKAGVDDDVIHAGENMLLTFTNVRNEVGKGNDIFDQATATVLDMSQALGQDTKNSAIQLGKALNDPIKGVGVLSRVGVSFTEQQKKQIQTLVKSGDTMGAQKIILAELSREFGGAATNIDPMQRSMANLKLDTVDLASGLLTGLMPALQAFVGILGKATSFMTEHGTATKIVVGLLAGLATTIVLVNGTMALFATDGALVVGVTRLWTATQWLLNAALAANPIVLVIAGLVALAAAIVLAWTKSETFRHIVTSAWNAIRSTTLSVFNGIKDFFVTYWPYLLAIVGGPVGAIAALVITKWGAIKSTTESVWDGIKGTVLGVIRAIRSTAETVFNGIVETVKAVVKPLSAAAGAIKGALQPIISVLQSIANAARDAISAISSIKDAAGGIAGKVGGVLGHIPGFASGVRNFSGGLAVVGENGPEIVNLPPGADVYSNSESRGMMGRSVTVNINGAQAGPLDERQLANVLRRAELLAA